jgi:xanthine dehydrogenase large subunit
VNAPLKPKNPESPEKIVGQNIPHDSARGHVSGETRYVDDIPLARNELLVDFYGSPTAHGRVTHVDLAEARQIPGIVALFTHADLDGHNRFGPIFQDEVLLVEDLVEFIGQPIVVIAAESRKAIQRAKAAIRVVIEALPPVLSIDDARARQQFIGKTRVIERGKPEQAFADAAHILEGRFYNNGQEHFYLESQSAIAYPGEHNTLTIQSSTQHPTEVQAVIAELLGLGFHQVVVETKRMGGAFGGKESQATHPAAMAALVALKTKRPARLVLSVDDDMISTGKRHAFHNDYKVAFTSDGLITALETNLYSNGGAANDLSTAVMGRAMCHAENAYYIPNIKITGTICKTNLPPNTAFRGFGGPQGIVNMENIIEEIAQYLDKDPFDIRVLNCYGVTERNITPYGQIVENNHLPEIFQDLAKRADYKNRLEQIQVFNQTSSLHQNLYLKGISLTPVKFGISFNTKFLNQASALVNIFLDGTVQVSTGATEMGQGVNTKIAQIVAEELCLPIEAIRMMTTSTEKSNNASATAASSGSDLNGSAAVEACRKLKARLIECASRHLAPNGLAPAVDHIDWDASGFRDNRQPTETLRFTQLVRLAYLDRVSLGERGFYTTPGLSFDWEHEDPESGQITAHGSPFLYFTTGCACSEVRIDRFTGDVKVLRTDILMDIGQSINPGIDRGQIAGAFVQGMGWVTTEDLRYSEKGALLTHSPTTYKIPNIQDLPEIFNIDWIDNRDNAVNLRRSKAVGEPPLMLAISVWTAVKHALSFVASSASGREIARLNLPATNEEVLSRLMHYAEKRNAKAANLSPERSLSASKNEPLLE